MGMKPSKPRADDLRLPHTSSLLLGSGFGSKGAPLVRDPNQDDRVWVLFDWKEESFQSFLSAPRSRRSFKKPGTRVGPRRRSLAASTTRSPRPAPLSSQAD